jgi:16S rRNA (cytosine967-C5)-methyltransferase
VIAPARVAAFDILLAVEVDARHADDLLHGAALKNLTPRDRTLATMLVMGTLRWQLALDAAIAPLLRAGTKLAPEVAIALRMGLLQLWFLDRVPPHAALSESVELAKVSGFTGMAGLVNAILRKLQRQQPPEFSRAAVLAHPAWMVDRWRTIYGAERTQRICEADQEIPLVTIRSGMSQPDNEAAPGALLTRATTPNAEHAAPDLRHRIQDEGSQLVAEIAAASAPRATRVLDACAAPGGKTAILAERLPHADIVAADISAPRLKLMQRLMPEFSPQIQCVQADAAQLPNTGPLAMPFDLVLCDVPCSGTGTLARNPEIRLRLSPAMLPQFAQKQLQIIKSCWQRLRPGGTLVYSTCSLEPEENAQVITQFRRAFPIAQPLAARELLTAMQAGGTLTPSGHALLCESTVEGNYLRTLPGVHPCDGFFIAVLRKPDAEA